MIRFVAVVALACVLAPSAGSAQSHQQPYAGYQQRSIKALSDAQIGELRAGKGTGLALAAELNGYPGPRHVLDMADAMHLSDDQRAKVDRLFSAMKAETVAIGERLIAQETHLDRLFADKRITPETLTATTRAIGATQAELRAAHLKYHLQTLEILTPSQVHRYAELRGYAGGGGHDPSRHHHH